MTRVIELDLDTPDPSALERLWHELERRHALRDVNPELRTAIEKGTDVAEAAGRIDGEKAAEIRSALNESNPRLVLDAYRRDLIEDRPTVGFFQQQAATYKKLQREKLRTETEQSWQENPEQLVNVVLQMARFCRDEARVVEAALEYADNVGIPEPQAIELVTKAVLQARGSARAS